MLLAVLEAANSVDLRLDVRHGAWLPTARVPPCRSRCRSGRCCQTIALFFILAMWLVDDDPLLPVVVMTMSTPSGPSTSSSGMTLGALHGCLERADRVDLVITITGALRLAATGAALADVTVAADRRRLAARSSRRWRAMMPSASEWRQPYTLSNFDLVTESLTLMAGNMQGRRSWPSRTDGARQWWSPRRRRPGPAAILVQRRGSSVSVLGDDAEHALELLVVGGCRVRQDLVLGGTPPT